MGMVPVYNSETDFQVPPFGVMEITGELDEEGRIIICLPTKNGITNVLVNGRLPIEPETGGQAHSDFPCPMACNQSYGVEPGQIWGVREGQWELSPDLPGFEVVGGFAYGYAAFIRENARGFIGLLFARVYKETLPAFTLTEGFLVADAAGAFPVTEGITLTNGDTFLYNPSGGSARAGVYELTSTGDALLKWKARRTWDLSRSDQAQCGLLVNIEEGSTSAGRIYRLATANPIVLDTTSISFSRTPNNLTVEITGGTPSYTSIHTISFGIPGFSLSNPSAGVVGVGLVQAAYNTAGIINTTSGQYLGAGQKIVESLGILDMAVGSGFDITCSSPNILTISSGTLSSSLAIVGRNISWGDGGGLFTELDPFSLDISVRLNSFEQVFSDDGLGNTDIGYYFLLGSDNGASSLYIQTGTTGGGSPIYAQGQTGTDPCGSAFVNGWCVTLGTTVNGSVLSGDIDGGEW